MANKTSSDNLIGKLKNKGLIINDPSFARDKLERKGYYNIINAYKNLFKDKNNNDLYLKGTTFEEIYSMYEFDSSLRILLLKYIFMAENEFKSITSNQILNKYKCYPYFSNSLYTSSSKEKIAFLEKHICDIYKKNKTNPMIMHFLDKGEMVPLHALINLFDFGTIRNFYDTLDESLKNRIAKIYKISSKELISMLSILNAYRNICAHNNRLYNYKINNEEMQLSNLDIHFKLNIPKDKNNKFIKGKNDLFAVIISLKYLLTKEDFNGLINELDSLIKTLDSNLKVIKSNKILDEMGFISKDINTNQKDWKEIVNY